MFILVTGCSPVNKKKNTFTIQGQAAPEITTTHGWVNTDSNYSLKSFHGKIVLLDFWTLGCINCQHVISDLNRLQQQYASNLVVIGVHSAKFTSEKQTQRIKDAIEKFGIDHPVVNDADFKIWNAYGVESWPTLVLISPDGKIARKQDGENVYDAFNTDIQKLIKEYDGEIDTTPFVFKKNNDKSTSLLHFPSKIIAGKDGNIWLSDNGNHRIVQIDTSGKILQVIGAGKRGFTNGSFADATFNEPQGLAVQNNNLFIADTRNNAIRLANLSTGQVSTVAGNGQMGYYFNNEMWDKPVLPNSPWDLLIYNNYLYIADAGNHQLLRMGLGDNKVYRFAGTGREGIQDGNIRQCTFSQPSGLAMQDSSIYIADPEASAVRKLNLSNNTIHTVIGKGLFKFGDIDGHAKDALLQHCTGLAENEGNIYIADTYNGKVKMFDTKKSIVTTLITGLDEPNGILFLNGWLWITDTNHHQIIKYNIAAKSKKVVQVRE